MDYLALFILACLFAFIYFGFFFPDPRFLRKGVEMRAFLWALRIGLPILFAGILFLFIRIREGSIPYIVLPIGGASALFAFLAVYPFAVWIYNRSYEHQLDRFHPYLQLTPDTLVLRSAEKKPFTVVCLGGSTTEYTDHAGKGWPERVEALVADSLPGREIQFYNQGRQWYTTQHILFNYLVNIRPHRPDAIIIMEAVNDLLINADFSYLSHAPFREDYGHFYGPENRIIHRTSLLEFAGESLSALWYQKPRQEIVTNEFPGLVPYRRNLETLIELAEADGTQVILMTQPYLFKDNMTKEELDKLHMINYEAIGPSRWWSVATAKSGMQRYLSVMREVASRHHLMLIDLEPAIPKTLEYFKDDVHYTDSAFDSVAAFVSGQLLTNKEIWSVNHDVS